MSKKEKLIEKWRRSTDYEEYSTVESFLNHLGYEVKSRGTSHHVFRKAGKPPIQIVKNGDRVKPVYLREMIKTLEELDEI